MTSDTRNNHNRIEVSSMAFGLPKDIKENIFNPESPPFASIHNLLHKWYGNGPGVDVFLKMRLLGCDELTAAWNAQRAHDTHVTDRKFDEAHSQLTMLKDRWRWDRTTSQAAHLANRYSTLIAKQPIQYVTETLRCTRSRIAEFAKHNFLVRVWTSNNEVIKPCPPICPLDAHGPCGVIRQHKQDQIPLPPPQK